MLDTRLLANLAGGVVEQPQPAELALAAGRSSAQLPAQLAGTWTVVASKQSGPPATVRVVVTFAKP